MNSYYRSAAICERGHVVTTIMESSPVGKRCVECGAPVFVACGECGHRIRGAYIIPGFVGGDDYEPPMFCDDYGAAFPWAGRRERLYELANLAKQKRRLTKRRGYGS
jgi:hypothetical protein